MSGITNCAACSDRFQGNRMLRAMYGEAVRLLGREGARQWLVKTMHPLHEAEHGPDLSASDATPNGRQA